MLSWGEKDLCAGYTSVPDGICRFPTADNLTVVANIRTASALSTNDRQEQREQRTVRARPQRPLLLRHHLHGMPFTNLIPCMLL